MTSRHEPLVSVVTPVYNGESYLRECIESVLAQTYTNWDYVIVNNCSSDRTLDIAREYATRDPRIRVYSNETFARVIENHNIGLRLISPETKYCKVVAADDWIFPECLAKMVRLAEEHPRVAIVSSYQLKETKVIGDGLPYTSAVVHGRDVCRTWLLGGPYVFGTPTSLLFRSDIVRSRHAFFNESNLHADAEACLEFLEHHDFGFVHEVLTFTRVREGSLTSFSQQFETYLPHQLYALVTYGPKYLSEQELQYRIRWQLQVYYNYLGWQIYELRTRDFWNYHRAKLATLGYHLRTHRLVASAMVHVLNRLLNPKRTVEGAVRRLRKSFQLLDNDKPLLECVVPFILAIGLQM
jgi:glycosyltransferase involved in cell wall biosynthesis